MLAPQRLAPRTTAIKRRPLPTGWISACVALFLMVFGIAPALATNGTWTDTTSGGLWNSMFDWSSFTIANGTDGIADFSTLNITSDDTVHLDGARTIGQLKFGDTTPSNNWILDNDGGALDVLTLAVTSGTPTITVNNDTATISAVLAGSQGLAKSGAGVLLLSGNNTFLGSVTVSAGTLALGNGGALPNGNTAVGVSAGATLDLGGQTFGTNALSISGAGVGGNGALINSSASAASFAGTVTASAPFRVGGSGDITLSGSVNSATNTLTKIGSNTLTLSGSTDNNNLAVAVNSGTVVLAKASGGSPNDVHAIGQPGLTVNGGIAQLGGTGNDQIYSVGSVTVTSGAFDTNGRNELFFTLNLQGSGIGNAGALVNSAAGVSTITPTGGTTLTANATIGVTQSAGTLALGSTIGGNFALTKTGAGFLAIFGNSTFSGGLTVQQGTLALGDTINNAGTNGVLGNNTSVTLGSNGQTGTLIFDDTVGSTASNMPFTLAAGGTGGFYVIADSPRQLSGAISGAGALLVTGDGGGTLTLSGNNTFTGGVTINNGSTLQVGSAGALNASAPNVVTFGAATLGESSGPFLTLGGFSITVSGLNAIADNSGYLPTVQNASSTAAALTVNNTSSNTYAGVLQDGAGGGALSLVKNGSGTLTLGGNNSFTGTTNVNAGTLILGNANALGSTAGGTFVADGATLDLGGQAVGAEPLTIIGAGVGGNGALINSGASAASFAGTVTASAPFRVGGSGDITLSGSVNGANNVLTKIGNNTLTLSGTTDNNSLAVTVNSGTVVLAKTSSGSPNDVHAIGQDMLTVNGGTAQLGGTGGDQIYDFGSVTVTSGTFDTNGRNETFATLNLQGTGISGAGALVNSAGGASAITPSDGTTLTGDTTIGVTQLSGSLTLNNSIRSNVALTKVGAGTLVLNGNPTLNANSSLLVDGGRLRFNVVSGAATIGTGVTATIAPGATLELAGSVSALSSATNRVNVANNSTAPGLLVSGTHQQVGNIDGSGVTQVDAGSDLTANHIIQSALVIGGVAGSPALVTIAASDSSGNPLAESNGLALTGSLQPTTPFAAGAPSSSNLDLPSAEGFSGDPIPAGPGAVGFGTGSNPSAVPEPSTLALVALALCGLAARRMTTAPV